MQLPYTGVCVPCVRKTGSTSMPFRPYVVKTADVVFFRESRTGYNILAVIMAEMCKTLQHCAHGTLKNGPADTQLL